MRVLLFVAIATACLAQTPGLRVLVVTNSEYRNLPAAPWTLADGDLLQRVFTEIRPPDYAAVKPAVTRAANLDFDTLFTKIEDEFIESVQPGDVAILSLSGYAMQVADKNYFLGIDFDPAGARPMRDRAYQLDRLTTGLEKRGAHLALVIIDGAYDVPALASVAEYFPGLAASASIKNGIIVYSSAANTPAARPSAAPSVFATNLAQAFQLPGLSAGELVRRAAEGVSKDTSDAQRPYRYVDYLGQFLFVKAPEVKLELKEDEGPKRLQHSADRQYYVRIPPGRFLMGCVNSNCEPREIPQHEVEISRGFWIGEQEVTAEAYDRAVKLSDRKLKMPRAPLGFDGWRDSSVPVTMISWEEAQSFCGWLGGRLPSEAEWEYVARAGVANQEFPMSDFASARDVANFKGTSKNDVYDWVAPGRKFDKNPWGLHDLYGNVWEWVGDYYDPEYYRISPSADPTGPAAAKERVIRGGSFNSDAAIHLRLSYREGASKATNNVGFRCLLPDTPATLSNLR